MSFLKMDYTKIKYLISLREEYWENNFDTNALGWDIPENEIIKNAYQLGVIGAIVKQIPIEVFKKLSLEERLILDLEVLGINWQTSTIDDSSDFKIGNDYTNFCWLISLLSNGKSFHFIRKSYEGIWYQKWGYFSPVINFDFDKKIIANPNDTNFGEYKLIKTYKLSCTEKDF